MRARLSRSACPATVAAGGLVLAAALATVTCGSSSKASATGAQPAPHVAVVQATRHDVSNELSIAAELEPYQQVDVYAKVSGYIRTLNVDWGTHVKEGQVLAVLEVPELRQQLEVDKAAVARNDQELSRSREDLTRAQSGYSLAHTTFTRLTNVQKTRPELVAQEDIDVAQDKDQQASAAVSSAKDNVAASEQQLAESKASYERDNALFAYTSITAPFDGVVTEIDAYKGALLPAGTSSNKGDQALCKLSQNNLLRLVIPVPERAVMDLHQGDTVAVAISGVNRQFTGEVKRLADRIDSETRTMHTEVDVPNPTFALVPGMYATVTIPLSTVHDAITVPVQAVQASGEDRGVVLVVTSDNRIERRDVTLGVQSPHEVQVVSGLKAGERVVFGEQAQFVPGQLVVPSLITPSNAG